MKLRYGLGLAFLSTLVAGAALAEGDLRTRAKGLFEPVPASVATLAGERVTPEKVSLGAMLFFDQRLSENEDLSCNRCHNLGMGGVAGQSAVSGHLGELGGRNVLTVYNAVFNKSQYWDGRSEGLKEQAAASVMANPHALLKARGGPMLGSAAELVLTRQHAVERFKAIPGYAEPFKKAFPGEAEPITYDNIARAIAHFETTLITPDAPFDLWLKGDDKALTDEQKQGLALFIDKGCAGCHNGVNVGGGGYARFGVVQNPGPQYLPPDDAGRAFITKSPADKYVFKIPGLRNVELTGPYFHSGDAEDLTTIIRVMGTSQLGVKLTDDEIGKIEAFLKSLTGKPPRIVLPILPPTVHVSPTQK
jgi:cytochrome c peroxidase